MRLLTAICFVCVCGAALSTSEKAFSQTSQPTNTWQNPQLQNRVPTPAMQYFGGARVTPTPAPQRRNLAPAPQHVQVARRTKPFQDAMRPQTLSPYLNLDRLESETSLPNYHFFVRPQLEQQRETRQQAMQEQRLRQRGRTARAPGRTSPYSSGNVPTTGHSAQFLNVGGYFPGLQR